MRCFLFLLLPLLFSASPLKALLKKTEKSSAVRKNTSQSPSDKKTTHCEIRGDLLYWVPEVSGLDVDFGNGSGLQTTIDGVSTTFSQETDTDPSFHWNVGYRVALGLQWDHNRWEFDGIWTDFQGFGYKPLNRGRWKVRLHQLDFAALYNACINPSVTLQPFIGLRGASIFQKLFSQVSTEVIFPESGTALDTRTFHDHEQFYGLGPLLGLNGIYTLKYGLGFYGTVAFSLLYGAYHLHFKDTEVITLPAPPSQIYSTINKDMKAFDFDVDFVLGIQWQYLIRNTCYLTMKLGLENHQYFNQSRLGKNTGSLSFSGGVFSFSLMF